ncbi:MAG: ABC transporter substrate-binding protein, partial [Candidatus Heimdallarchaeota archaeon]
QVVEGLFAYNLSDPKMGVIPNLALDYGTWSGNNYTVDLKPNIYFHDGTLFDAYAVKFTFDRLAYFMENSMAAAADLYKYYDIQASKIKNIINHTEVINANTIRFVLNQKVGIFETLLCFEGSYIVSPTSTPATELIDLLTGTLVGTGPFVFENYIADSEVNFYAYENYWKGVSNVTNLKFSIITDELARNNALLSGDVDIITDPIDSMLDTYIANPNITLESIQGFTIGFIDMNDYWINTTFRNAISHAINYSYIITELLEGSGVRMKSPFPENMVYANWSYNVADFDVASARETMQSMGFGIGWDTTFGGPDEANWAAASFATFNYTYNIGNSFKEDLGVFLETSLDLIGIDVISYGMTWMDFIFRIIGLEGQHQNMLQLYFLNWVPDYNDPCSLTNYFFTNRSSVDFTIPFYDNMVQSWVEEALVETDTSLRNELYGKIQKRLVEELYPWAFCYVPLEYVAYRNEISGFQWNSMEKVSFYEVNGTSSDIPTPPITPITPFVIDDDGYGDYTWAEASNQPWCSGQGTEFDPYLIENIVIDGQSMEFCLEIRNSVVYFILSNCTFFNSYQGLKLSNVANGFIGGNFSNNFGSGISLISCSNLVISNTTTSDNGDSGITLSNTNNSWFLDNSIDNNLQTGIFTYESNDNLFLGNILRNNGMFGIYVHGKSNQFLENLMYGTGFILSPVSIASYSMEDIPVSNLLDGKPIYFYRDMINLDYGDFINAGQVMLYNCNDSSVANLVISNGTIGIYMVNCNRNAIQDISISKTIAAIYLVQSNHITINHCSLIDNIQMGIYLDRSNYTSISGNLIYNTPYNGITIYQSTNNIIFENNISHNSQGISVQWYSELNVIKNNSINNCVTYGISLDTSDNNLLYLNRFEQNSN